MIKTAIATILGASVLLALPAPAHAQDYRRGEVTCNSYHGHARTCQLPERGQVRLVHQLSSSACVNGRSWGQSGSHSVWVSRGCRGVFAVRRNRGGYDNRDNQGSYGDNRDNRDHGSYGDSRGGYDNHDGYGDNRGNDSGWVRDRNYAVECRANNGTRTVCAWDNRYGNPYMQQQVSGNCVEGRDWGYDSQGGLWVDRDCDARFGYH